MLIVIFITYSIINPKNILRIFENFVYLRSSYNLYQTYTVVGIDRLTDNTDNFLG